MSAGNTGQGTPDDGDDPFAYLYRPEAGQAQPPAGPRQPSYNQVRPVGERTFGGQQGYRQQQQQPSPDARYAAPETQPGGYGGGPPHDRRRADQDNRRNGLLIGAIAVVLAVVLGVGAAIFFSSGDGDDTAGGDQPTSEPTDDGAGEDEGGTGGEEEPEPEPEPDGLPTADVSRLPLAGDAAVEATIPGSRAESGSYIALQNQQGSGITWTFELTGDPGRYRLYTGYSVISDDQTLSFSINGMPRPDPVNLRDYNENSDAWEESWQSTYNLVDLVEGENTIEFTCADSCDVVIDQIYLSEPEPGD
ncbi:carbohydrate-binding protein [Streptomyces sp. DSM 44915]|uniref:Carbohydrate-binding protein n=1 Tax=Streptomyces chisholmiae TaxID=3075540 RepID=A0ABU2JSY3_9ACTN|nr:carbohydrate-binding protein [Streptomyces sp. DSM 44915]MDT0268098.1 carbohydrate-binding protein [Streptomyces sp. DSM 44915]